MTISSEQWRSWVAPGAQDAAQATYASVQAALSLYSALQSLDYEVFLQGSYANSTNIRSDSDVDIVVMLKNTFVPDTKRLSPWEKQNYEASRIPATITSDWFRQTVHDALVYYYGATRVQSKDKCLRVAKTTGGVDADVVPCLQHRIYTSFPSSGRPDFIEGVVIRPLSGGEVMNYPKEHKKNGSAKNSACNDKYKPTVRQLKRLRVRAVEQGLVGKDTLPGYLIECLTYNAPNPYFIADDSMRPQIVLDWLTKQSAPLWNAFKSCDEINRLFIEDPGKFDITTTATALGTLAAMPGL